MDCDTYLRVVQEQQLGRVLDMQRQIDAIDEFTAVLTDGHLADLHIHKGQALDIEETSLEFGPLFFRPRLSLQHAKQKIQESHGELAAEWPRRCRRGSFVDGFEEPDTVYDPEDPHPLCVRENEAYSKLNWCLASIDGIMDQTDWRETITLGTYEGAGLPMHFAINEDCRPSRYTFHNRYALLLEGSSETRPHIAGAVYDSTESDGDCVTRGEVVTALALLKYQLGRSELRDHHTVPVLVFSFEHDKHGRVTQFHLAGERLVVRQSRQLDLCMDEPTADAYHMMRWMANRPIGETRYATPGDQQVGPQAMEKKDANGGLLAVRVRA